MKILVLLSISLIIIAQEQPQSIIVTNPNEITKKIPLNIIHLLPSNLLLQNRQAITIVYNRAVIPIGSDFGQNYTKKENLPFRIGCNVPGKYHWVTTSIFRFDPDIDWPTDLSCPLLIDEEIETFDGNKLMNDIPKRNYYTPKLTMKIQNVVSKMAQNVTGNNWDADISNHDGPEIPPDSTVELYFNNPISIEKIKNNLIIKRKSTNEVVSKNLHMKDCSVGSNCIQISIPSNLKNYDMYTFELPKGISYHSLSDELTETLINSFRSLLEFKFYFKKNTNVRFNRWNLWLIHGLSKDSSLDVLSTFIKIKPTSKFVLKKLNEGMIQICGSFLPNKEYQIEIDSTDQIHDGFGLPLKSSSSKFFTGSYSDFMEIPNEDFVSFTETPDIWKAFVRKGSKNQINFYNIDDSNLKSIFSIYQSGIDSKPLKSILPSNNHSMLIPAFNSNDFLLNSGIFLSEKITSNPYGSYKNYHFVNEAPFIVNFISLQFGKLIVWVVSSTGFDDIENAKITIFRNGEILQEKITGKQGIAEFDEIYSDNGSISAIVSLNENVVLIRYLNVAYSTRKQIVQTTYMISDRQIYNLGDFIHVKGYLREYDENTLEMKIPKGDVLVELIPSFDKHSKFSHLDPEFGSFYAKFRIPLNATFGPQSIRTGNYNSYISFVIADPRLPTAEISIDSSKQFISLDSSIRLDITASTYTGNGIENYPITIRWIIYKPTYCPFQYGIDFGRSLICKPREVVYEDQKEFKTGHNGLITFDYSLPNHQNITFDRILEIEIEIKSITREIIKKKISIPIQPSNWKIDAIPSNNDPIPGYKFYFSTSVHDLNGKLIPGIPIDSILYEWNGITPVFDLKGKLVLKNPPLQSCSSRSTSENEFDCSFKLEKPSKYIIISSSTDSFGNKIHSQTPIGKTEEEWENNKLNRISSINFKTDKNEYVVGDVATINFENPFKKGVLFWVINNNQISENNKKIVELGLQSIKVPIAKKYKNGFIITFILYSPENEGLDLKIRVPISKVYDPFAPQSIKQQMTINVVNDKKPIEISIKPESDIFKPRSKVHITIDLQDGISKKPIGGEITYWLVDKSILDLKPNIIEKGDIFKRNQYFYNSITTSVDSFSSKNIYQRTFQTLKRRFEKDGYITQSWPLNGFAWDLDISDEEFFKRYFTLLTEYRKKYEEEPIRYLEDGSSSSPRMAFEKADGVQSVNTPKASSTDSSTEQDFLRSLFSITPVFVDHAIINSTGSLDISFDIPDNVGSYIFNVMAINQNMYGYENETIIARKDVNLNPSIPRFVRIGDEFNSGCSVTLSDGEEGSYQIRASLSEESGKFLKFEDDISTKKIILKKNEPQEVTFPMMAIGIGEAKLIYEIIGASNDAIEVSLPVLGIQEPVFVASSFSLIGDDSRKEQLSPVESFSDYQLNITSGVGKLPSMLVLSQQILDSSSNNFYLDYPYCIPDAYFSLLVPYLVSVMYPDAVEKTYSLNSKKLYSQTLEKLRKCTHPQYGLQYGLERDINRNPEYNSHLNSIGLYFSKKLNENDVSLPTDLVNIWKDSLIAGLKHNDKISLNTIALSNYVLKDKWKPNENQNTDYLLKHQSELNVGGKSSLVISLLLKTPGSSESKEIKEILKSIIDSFRIQGRTAYLATSPGSQFVSNIISSSLAIDMFVVLKYESPLLEKMSNYLGNYYSSDIGFNILALNTYDKYRGNDNPNLNLVVNLGTMKIIEKKFDDKSELISSKTFSLPSTLSNETLQFMSTGKGEVSIAVGLLFEPKLLNINPIYGGFLVEKAIRLVDPLTKESYGPSISNAKPGSLVSIVIQITSTDDIFENIKIVDRLPGCIEAIDPNIEDTVDLLKEFPITVPGQYKKDKVTFVLRGMNAGMRVIEYKGFVVSSGMFVS
eukprot:gene8821-770_t